MSVAVITRTHWLEGPYMNEFIRWYLYWGFNHIYLVSKEVLEKHYGTLEDQHDIINKLQHAIICLRKQKALITINAGRKYTDFCIKYWKAGGYF